MRINEACKYTRLTKKAIEYYTAQGLLFPRTLDNGYRDFSPADLDRLARIAVLRKLGLSTEEIRAVLADKTNTTLQKISTKRELKSQQELAKKAVLDRLAGGAPMAEIAAALDAIAQSATITEKLLEAFPGYYGRFVCLHFARFLTEPITTANQLAAYEEIVAFLDCAPMPPLPDELQAYLTENTKHISTENICQMTASYTEAIADPDAFFAANKETLDDYLAYKQSPEYKASPLCKIKALLTEFNKTGGYYDVFLPAMKRLSRSYAAYSSDLTRANNAFLLRYPQAATLDEPAE